MAVDVVFRPGVQRSVAFGGRRSSFSEPLRGWLFPGESAVGRKRAPAVRQTRTSSGAEIGRAERRRALRINVAAGAVVLIVGLFHAWTGLRVDQLGYALSDARILSERLDQEMHELTIEYAAETAQPRLEREAAIRLGLRQPVRGEVVDLR